MACENGTIQNEAIIPPEFTTPGGASGTPVDENGNSTGPTDPNGGPMSSGQAVPGFDQDLGDAVNSDGSLGSLSARYESNGSPTAIGFDRTGGWSYGRYQLASNQGSVQGYMNYLRQVNPSAYQRLQSAGGYQAAQAGSEQFKSAWRSVMSDPSVAATQHTFARQTYYMPAARNIQASTGVNFSNRSAVLQDVVWSTGVQHGDTGAAAVYRNAQARSGLNAMSSDEQWIRAIYAERSRVGTYFRSSTPAVQSAVRDRFVREQADALARIGQ